MHSAPSFPPMSSPATLPITMEDGGGNRAHWASSASSSACAAEPSPMNLSPSCIAHFTRLLPASIASINFCLALYSRRSSDTAQTQFAAIEFAQSGSGMQQQCTVVADTLHPAFYFRIVWHPHAHHFILVGMQLVPLLAE